jgi:hypothetical protein
MGQRKGEKEMTRKINVTGEFSLTLVVEEESTFTHISTPEEEPIELPWEHKELSSVVIIKFKDDTDIRLEDGEFVPPDRLEKEFERYRDIFRRFEAKDAARLFARSDDELRAERDEFFPGRSPDLTQHFQITVSPDLHRDFITALNSLDYTEIAYTAPLPTPPPTHFPSKQQYVKRTLLPSLVLCGIDAEHAWNYEPDGSRGLGMTVAVIDYHWNLNHKDLPAGPISAPGPLPATTDLELRNHGTAAVGVLLAEHDDKGMHGIVPYAEARMYAADTDLAPPVNVADAISLATGDLLPGDVILIEQQTSTLDGEFVPVEYHAAEFSAILAATQKKIIVVEPAGNGSHNLDDYQDKFNLDDRDSGAIIVGAGQPARRLHTEPCPLSRYEPSNYGDRVNVQGWGHHVGTLGYGDLAPSPALPHPLSEDDLYTDNYGGTSSATAIVAGAVVSLQGICRIKGWGDSIHEGIRQLSPGYMRQLLMDTGTAQQDPAAALERIGPLPNLRNAIARLEQEFNPV